MIPLDDPRRKELHGGFRMPYDASDTLRRLEQGDDVWDELWGNLHHQGDIGEASYAAVPHLARIAKGLTSRDWNPYSLVSTIEIERHRKANPPLPSWLEDDYRAAWQEILLMAITDLSSVNDPLTIRSILGAVALAKGQLKLGAMISYLDKSEIDEFLEEHDAWSRLYRTP
jgi:hypothetical protein